MKNTGIIKKFDELGRIVLPMEIRKSKDWNYKDTIEIYTKGNDIILEKVEKKNLSGGMVRKIDELGRVVIPIEIRNTFMLDEGDGVEVYTENEKIILRKYYEGCIYCGSKKKVYKLLEKPICEKCIEKIKEKI